MREGTAGASHPLDHTRAARRSYFIGVALLLAAAVLWSLNGAFIKLIYRDGQGPHGITIAFGRSLIAGLFLIPLARGKFHTLTRRSAGAPGTAPASGAVPPVAEHRSLPAILCSLRPAAVCSVPFFALLTACFVVAATRTAAANAIILQYTSTFWVFGLSPWVVREKPRAVDVRAMALAMAGVTIIFAGNASSDIIALCIALAAGLFYGLLTLMIRQMRDSDPAAVTVLNSLGSAALLFPATFLVGGLMMPLRAALLLILMGVVQFGFPYYLYSLGLARVPAHRAALITMLEAVLVPVWTYLAVRETVPWPTVVGGSVILAALLLLLIPTKRRACESTDDGPDRAVAGF